MDRCVIFGVCFFGWIFWLTVSSKGPYIFLRDSANSCHWKNTLNPTPIQFPLPQFLHFDHQKQTQLKGAETANHTSNSFINYYTLWFFHHRKKIVASREKEMAMQILKVLCGCLRCSCFCIAVNFFFFVGNLSFCCSSFFLDFCLVIFNGFDWIIGVFQFLMGCCRDFI
jgi:hypothetical protein